MKSKIHVLDAPWIDVSPPAGWPWSLPFTIQQKGRNFRVKPDFNLFTYANIPAGTNYFVKPDGVDGNSGLDWNNALRNIATAAAKPNANIVYIWAGSYCPEAANDQGTWGISSGLNARAFIGVGGMVRHTAAWPFYAPTWNWTLDTNHYELAVGPVRATNHVRDFNFLDSTGKAIEYTLALNEAAVDATPGTYFKDGSNVLHCHTLDNRKPDYLMRFYQSGSNNCVISANNTIYCENISCEGAGLDMYPARVLPLIAGDIAKAYFKNCEFSYAKGTRNLFTNFGATETILDGCISRYGDQDGNNYTPYLSVIPKAIEINCEAFYTGTDGIDQASTVHQGTNIVRIMGRYHHCTGITTVAEAGGPGSYAWNLGSEIFNPDGVNGYYVDAGSQGWLDCCNIHDIPQYALQVADSLSAIRYRNLISSGNFYNNGGILTTY